MSKEELTPTEGKIQAECFQWFYNSFPHLRGLLYHVPNGEKRDKITASLLKAKGVVAGVPDLCFHFRARTYFIEMKKPGGALSESQVKIHEQLDRQGFIVWIVETLEDFQRLLISIIGDISPQFTHGLTRSDWDYKNNVFNYLYELREDDVIRISDICEEANASKFVTYVSEFITEGYDRLEGFEILFTPDYKGFYKEAKGQYND